MAKKKTPQQEVYEIAERITGTVESWKSHKVNGCNDPFYQISPHQDVQRELEVERMERSMDRVGLVFVGVGVILLATLLVYHLNWWVVPTLVSAAVLGWIVREWRGIYGAKKEKVEEKTDGRKGCTAA